MKYLVLSIIAIILVSLLAMQIYLFVGKNPNRKADIIETDVMIMTALVVCLLVLFVRSFFM